MHRLAAVLVLLASLAVPRPASASDRWQLTGWSWFYAHRITVCIWQGAGVANPAGPGTAWAVPPEYHSLIRTAVNAWNEAGAPAGVHSEVVDRCTDRTEVVVLAFDADQQPDGRWHVGQGGCDHSPDEGDWVPTDHLCDPQGGVLLLNRRLPVAGLESFWIFALGHEYGHVLGLDHPACSPGCRDTIMSEGACKRDDQYYCRTVPSADDTAGLRAAYEGRGGGGGACLARPDPSVMLPRAFTLGGEPPVSVDSRGDVFGPPLPGIPDPALLTDSVPPVSGDMVNPARVVAARVNSEWRGATGTALLDGC